jgi:hypothetical protein
MSAFMKGAQKALLQQLDSVFVPLQSRIRPSARAVQEFVATLPSTLL